MTKIKRIVCQVLNTDLVSYEEPRRGNPFETTVYAWEANEASCERLKDHTGSHGFTHNKTYLEFTR